MAKYIHKKATVTVNSVAISDRASAITVDDSAEEVDQTTFGADYREMNQGLKDATSTVTFTQDFAAGEVHATLQPLYASGATFPLEITPTDDAVSATNPKITMTARLFSYSPVSGSIGDSATVEATFRNASGTGVTYVTA